jgi:hypothetical protein
MAKEPNTIESILFEIARTMDYIRHDPNATGYLKAKVVGRMMDMDLIEWKGGKRAVIGGEWYEIPSLMREMSELLARTHGPVKSFTGQFSPQDVLTLQAKGKGGVLGEWTLAYTRKPRKESPELIEQAGDVSGVPESIVGALRSLNDVLRKRLFPLKPKAEIPVKFWNIADPEVQLTALQYLYLELLKPFGYDDAAVPPLPQGYTTVCTIFHVFEELDNEGFETAIENLGWGYRDSLVKELNRVGLPALGDLFSKAWLAHPKGATPNARSFKTVTAKLSDLIDDHDATLYPIHLYVVANKRLFEKAT